MEKKEFINIVPSERIDYCYECKKEHGYYKCPLYSQTGFKSDSKIKITTFESGAIRDTQEGKLDYVETLSFTALNRYIAYMTGKKIKYGSGNFKKGIPIESYEKSLMRHIDKYMRNKFENGNDEKNEDHLSAIIFNVFGIMHEEEMAKIKTATN